jgi:hypothetical protein
MRGWRTRGRDEACDQYHVDERDQEESGDDTRMRHADAPPAQRRLSRKPRLHVSANAAPRGGQIGEGAAASKAAANQQRDTERCHETDKQFHLELLERNERLLAVANWRAGESGNKAAER